MKKNVLVLGAGGVAHVTAHKCAEHASVFGKVSIASRTIEKCDQIIASIRQRKYKNADEIRSYAVNAHDVGAVKALIQETDSQIVINVCSPFVNKTIFDACIESGAAYIDTAMYEIPVGGLDTPPWYANYEWKWKDKCRAANCTAIIGAGFDPGVVNTYAAYADQHYFDSIESIDILDVNHGSHGKYFATNFDPEINLREFRDDVLSWQNKTWVTHPPFSVKKIYDFPVVGKQDLYLTNHDEVHSLSQLLDIDSVRFWMGFSEHYINVYTVLKNLGLLSNAPVKTAEGLEVIPIKVVKAVLPDPASLAINYEGKTCIGNHTVGIKNGQKKEMLIYNLMDHHEAYQEVGSQAISYTAGVPPVAAALLIAEGQWDVGQMVNIESLPSKPFIKKLAELGLKTYLRDEDGDREIDY